MKHWRSWALAAHSFPSLLMYWTILFDIITTVFVIFLLTAPECRHFIFIEGGSCASREH